MNWRIKAGLFWGFHLMPGGSRLHYLAQRHLTHSLPRRIDPLADHAGPYVAHVSALSREWQRWPARHVFEFGAGPDLFGNLLLWCCGVDRQTVVDISPLLKPELINGVLATLRAQPLPQFVRTPPHLVSHRGFLGELRDVYGIDYRAPADARAVDLPAGSIDLVVTTSTMEHIPAADIRRILDECHRLCADEAALSMVIDYSDHYSHADSSVTPYNFLAYNDDAWRRYNPPNHFQNRLRHCDHRALIEAAGFSVIYEDTTQPADASDALARVRLDRRFVAYPRDLLLPTCGHMIATRDR